MICTPRPTDRLRVRRHVALISFVATLTTLTALVVLAYVGGPQAAAVMSAISTNLGIILTALTGIVGAWFHAAHKQDLETKNDRQTA